MKAGEGFVGGKVCLALFGSKASADRVTWWSPLIEVKINKKEIT